MTLNSNKLILALLTVLATAGSAGAQRMGSIYNSRAAPLRTIANKTAHRTGDLVTVIISETQDIRNEEKSELSKESALNYQLLNFDIKPEAFDPLPAIATRKADEFTGDATYEKKGAFKARLTAIVMDTLPNGNLVIQGRREVRVDGEVKVLEFSGIVRRYDVSRTNTVESELVADARVTYTGSGPMTRATNRVGLSGWLHDAIDWLWPF
jgi:flagellar L-ring protein precursor FlgH